MLGGWGGWATNECCSQQTDLNCTQTLNHNSGHEAHLSGWATRLESATSGAGTYFRMPKSPQRWQARSRRSASPRHSITAAQDGGGAGQAGIGYGRGKHQQRVCVRESLPASLPLTSLHATCRRESRKDTPEQRAVQMLLRAHPPFHPPWCAAGPCQNSTEGTQPASHPPTPEMALQKESTAQRDPTDLWCAAGPGRSSAGPARSRAHRCKGVGVRQAGEPM